MFGLPSLTKLLVLAAIIIAVWYGFKLVGRLDAQRKAEGKQRRRRAPRGSEGSKTAPTRSGEQTEDMVKCPACDAYVPARQTRNCGRPDCPY